MDLSKLPYAVRETLAGFDILTRSGWPAGVVVLGSAEGRACVGIKGIGSVGVAPLPEGQTREEFHAALLAGKAAWNAAPAEERDALVKGSDLQLKVAPLLATFCAARE